MEQEHYRPTPYRPIPPGNAARGIFNGLGLSLILMVIAVFLYFLPRIFIGLSDVIIDLTGGSEVYLALFTGIGIGFCVGIIFYATVIYYRDK